MTLTIENDGTYILDQQTTTISGGFRLSQNDNEQGTYVINGSMLRTDDLNGLNTDYEIMEGGFFLERIAAITDLSCDRIFRLGR